MGKAVMDRHVWLGADAMITAAGFSTRETIRSLEAYKTGCRPLNDPRFSCVEFTAGSIDPAKLARMSREGDQTPLEMLLAAVITDVAQRSGTDMNDPRTLVILSTTKGDVDLLTGTEPLDERVYLNSLARRVASQVRTSNEPLVVSNACISGISAMVIGARLISWGSYDNIIVSGGDMLSRFIVTGFRSFRSLGNGVCRPYSEDRDGLTLGEAAGAVLLTADKRKAQEPFVEIGGGSISNDANHISGPSRTGDGLHIAIRGAMQQAGVDVDDIGFINGHGTATLYNDDMESLAYRLAGLDGTPVNSFKPLLGHTLGAAGVVETILTAQQLRQGVVFGTLGVERSGTVVPLNVSGIHRGLPGVRHCLKTASGFGGCNAAIVLSLERKQGHEKTPCHEAVSSAQNIIGPDRRIPFAEMIRARYKALGLPNMKFFKMDDMAKLGYITAEELLSGARLSDKYEPHEVGIVLCNRSSSLDSDIKHCAILESDGEEAASPAVFVYTLANIVAGEICIRHRIMGENTFFVTGDSTGEVAHSYGRSLIESGRLKAVITGVCELLGQDYYSRMVLWEKKES